MSIVTPQSSAGSQARLSVLADSVPVLLANCDADSRFKFVNKPYTERFGLRREDVIGKQVAEVLGERAYASLRPYIERVLAGEELEFDLEVPYAHGGTQFMRCSYAPERDDSGKVVGWFAALINIDDRRRAEDALQESEERYRRLAQLLPVGVYTCAAPMGVITYFNDQAAVLWGRAPHPGDTDERFCGSLGLYRPDGTYLPHAECPMAVALQEGRSFRNEEVFVQRPDGSRICVLVNIDPVRDGDNRVVGAVNVFHDVSALKEVQRALREADRRKDEFLATLSHELRNPLAPLGTALGMLDSGLDSPERFAELKGVMERQLAQLVRLIDDLLDVSRISRGKLRLRTERVKLQDVVCEAVETRRIMAAAKGQRIELRLPEPPISMEADRVRLGQIFGNLLHNASKYTPEGGLISVAVERRGGEALVTVADSGIGIAEEKLGSIFEMFSQVSQEGDTSQGGLGIGLSLARQFAELHGGTIEARSLGPGRGSEFTVRLTVRRAEDEDRPSEKTAPSARSHVTAGRRVLVVDDNTDAAAMLVMLLEMQGHDARAAHDGLQAVEQAEAFRPQVVLLDIGLPEMDGHEVCRALRGRPWGKEMLIAALTGWGQDEDRRKSMAAGFDAHLVKPIDVQRLAELLR